jgi:hypothetical protein
VTRVRGGCGQTSDATRDYQAAGGLFDAGVLGLAAS